MTSITSPESKLDLIVQAENEIIENEIIEKQSLKSAESGEQRETWSGKFDFFLSTLGYAVGLGAVWRFPYLCYRNGGGVFLIPYIFFLLLVGIPLVFLELAVGQFSSQGPLTCWTMIPIFKGIGLSMNIANLYLATYYNMIIAYSIYFLFLSFTSKLPWQQCNPLWSSPNCVDNYDPAYFHFDSCESNNTFKCDNGRCYMKTIDIIDNEEMVANCSTNTSLLNQTGWWNPNFPSQDYWNKVILRKSSGIDESGTIVWQLLLMLIIGWVIVFFTVFRGIKISGKVVYFTSLFPYVVLLILGIRVWVLPGASEGIKFYVFPNFSKLADIKVWSDAATQIFFTLSVSYGGLVALSSYNGFNTNIMRDAIVVSISNCLTSIFAGFVVFAFIGYLSHTTGQDIDKVIQAGQGLSFVVYPYAVTTIKGAPLWSILFFFMMIILGLDTQMASTEITITSVFDFFPNLRKKAKTRYLTIIGIVIVYFLLGILYTIQSGTYWIEIVDGYSGNWAILLVGAIETLCICWFYGFDRFKKDISIMIGENITNNKYFIIWKILWGYITPGLLLILVILVFRDTKRIQLKDYLFPYWFAFVIINVLLRKPSLDLLSQLNRSHVLGQFITASTLSGIILWGIWQYIDYAFIKKKPLINLIRPDFENWKPQKAEHLAMMRVAHKMETPEFNSEEKNGNENPVFDIETNV